MPTYEYECTICGRIFEEFQSITAKPKKVIPCRCVKCHNRAPVVRRIGTGSGIIFKGSGFYLTDYRSESYKKAAKAEQEATRPSEAAKPGPGDAKSKKGTKAEAGSTDSPSGSAKGKS